MDFSELGLEVFAFRIPRSRVNGVLGGSDRMWLGSVGGCRLNGDLIPKP